MTDSWTRHTLSPDTTLLHVGPPKTASTTLQSAFDRARAELPTHGVLPLVAEPRARAVVADLRAGRDSWLADLAAARAAGPTSREWISNEDFASLQDPVAATLLDGLGSKRTEIVYVVRPLERLLPSQWQQRVRRSLGAPAYDDWLRLVLAERSNDPHHLHFWARHRLQDQIHKWTTAPGRDVATLNFVIAREGDRDHLLHVFEVLMDLPEDLLRAAPSRNSSLSLSGAEVLRALDGKVLDLDLDRQRYTSRDKVHVARALRDRPKDPDDTPILLPQWAVSRVQELDQERVELLNQCNATIVGEPSWLLENKPRVRATVDQPAERIGVEAAAELLAWALDSDHRAHRRRQSARRRELAVRQELAESIAAPPDLRRAGTRELVRELSARLLRRR